MATKKKSGSKTAAGKRGGGSSRTWNGAERLAAIFPALGTVIPMRERLVSELPEAALKAEMNNNINAAIREAAEVSGASPDDISQWIEDFTYLGKPGLVTPVPLAAEDCAANIQGTFELETRLTDGSFTAARSRLYYDMDPQKRRGMHLITMWTEHNHFDRKLTKGDQSTLLLVALVEMTFKNRGKYEVEVRTRGRLVGNFGDYETGEEVADTFKLVRRGNNEAMVGVPSSYTFLGGRKSGGYTDSEYFNHALVKVSGDPGSIVFANLGLPAQGTKGRTLDVVDTYVNMGRKRPLIAGWEPVSDYFKRMTDPNSSLRRLQQLKKSDEAFHMFQTPPSLSTLRTYCEMTHDDHPRTTSY